MGLETRQRGGQYYYSKHRVGKRVVSQYVGAGELALLANMYAERERSKRDAEKALQRLEKEEAQEIDRMLGELANSINTLVEAALLSAGYHQHKGQWRKRREHRD